MILTNSNDLRDLPIKLAIIEDPFANGSDIQVKKIFGSILALRMEGYSAIHGTNIVPVDQYDYIAKHFLLYTEQNNEIIPLSCSRLSMYKKTALQGLEFPALKNLKVPNNSQTIDTINQIIKENEVKNNDTSYVDYFTISPSIKNMSQRQMVIKYMIGAILNYHKENNLNFICSATLKVKTDKLFYKLGGKWINDSNDIYSQRADFTGERND